MNAPKRARESAHARRNARKVTGTDNPAVIQVVATRGPGKWKIGATGRGGGVNGWQNPERKIAKWCRRDRLCRPAGPLALPAHCRTRRRLLCLGCLNRAFCPNCRLAAKLRPAPLPLRVPNSPEFVSARCALRLWGCAPLAVRISNKNVVAILGRVLVGGNPGRGPAALCPAFACRQPQSRRFAFRHGWSSWRPVRQAPFYISGPPKTRPVSHRSCQRWRPRRRAFRPPSSAGQRPHPARGRTPALPGRLHARRHDCSECPGSGSKNKTDGGGRAVSRGPPAPAIPRPPRAVRSAAALSRLAPLPAPPPKHGTKTTTYRTPRATGAGGGDLGERRCRHHPSNRCWRG